MSWSLVRLAVQSCALGREMQELGISLHHSIILLKLQGQTEVLKIQKTCPLQHREGVDYREPNLNRRVEMPGFLRHFQRHWIVLTWISGLGKCLDEAGRGDYQNR